MVNNATVTGSFTDYSMAAFNEWSSARCITQDESKWEQLGPYPNGLHNMGMIQALWCDPNDNNFLIAGSGRNSGIFRSIDGGNSWQDVLTPQKIPALGIKSFAVSPNKQSNMRVLYAATGGYEFSIGIIKSIDDGQTWSILNSFPLYDNANTNHNPSYKVEQIIVPQNISSSMLDIVYAIAYDPNIGQKCQKFFKSVDGGNTWMSPVSFPITTGLLIDMEVDPIDYSKIFVSSQSLGSQRAQVYYSSNGGLTWVEVLGNLNSTDINNNDISIAAIDYPSISTTNSRIYVEFVINTSVPKKYIAYSDNNGTSWIVDADYQGVPSNYLIANCHPAGSGDQFNPNAFEVSNDYSKIHIGSQYFMINRICSPNYKYYPDANTHADVRCIQLLGGNKIITANDGGISKSIDGGNTWISMNGNGNTSLRNNEIHGFSINDDNPDRVIVGLQDNSYLALIDDEWKSADFSYGDGYRCEIDPNNKDILYLVYSDYMYIVTIVNGIISSGFDRTIHILAEKAHINTPIAIHKSNSDRIYIGADNKIQITNDGGISWTVYTLPNLTGKVKNIKIAPSSPNIIYATTTTRTYGNPNTSAVYRSFNYGQSWVDITAGLTQSIPNGNIIVTDLAVSYTNPNKVWVGMGSIGVSGVNTENRVFRCDNADAASNVRDWINMTTNNISPLPVTAIVNQPGTDRVFIGTDAGIFYRDNNNDWQCFSKDFPVTSITQMKVNRKTSEIYASTYGYGLWKSHLPCVEGGVAGAVMEITSDITVQNDVTYGFNIIVKNNSTLTFTGGAVVAMGAGYKIIVEPGSSLIIDNATVTSGCGSYWKGIEVWGNDNLPQIPISNQGFVEVKNNGTIKNADVAIRTMKVNADGSWDWNSNGGNVRINGAKFLNNNNSIWIGSYHSPNRSVNISYITNSEFVLNNNMIDGHVGYSFIGLLDVDRISISGNSFINSQTDLNVDERARGIVAYNAAFNVKAICNDANQTNPPSPCVDLNKNYFEGLYYGVYASNSNASSSSVVNIDQADFVNVYHGVHLINTKNAVVTRSNFNIPESSQSGNVTYPYGIFINGSDGFKIEENSFVGANTWTGGRGVVIDNAGDNDNEIYNNIFSNLLAAIQPQYDNRDDINYSGLKLLCNNMSSDEFDVAIMPPGIAKYQQITLLDNGIQFYIPAGDKFTYCNDNSDQNISNYISGDINYLSKQGDEPNCVTYDANDHTHDVSVSFGSYNGNPECPSKISIGGDDISQLLTAYSVAKIALNSSQVIYNIWKDGGDANLEEQVETTQPWDVYVEFNNLLAKSPYLSEEVILATIENPSFTSLMIKLLMIANPSMNRNDEIMEAIYNRIPALPESYIEAINSGSSSASQLEILAANVSSDRHLLNITADNIKRIYRSDYDNANSINSLITFVSAENTLESQYELASLYLETDQFSSMNTVLSNISANYSLDEQLIAELANWQIYFGIAQSVKESTEQYGVLSETQIASLETLAELNRPLISSAAIALLLSDDNNYDYHEVVLPITESSARRAIVQQESPSLEKESILKVFPNPSNSYITLQYRTGTKYSKLWFVISDSKGSILMQQTLLGGDNEDNEELINTSKLAPNIYTLILYGDGERIAIEKITVIK